jgi:hypothetical protein
MRQRAPVYQVPDAGFFIVSRYADILHVLRLRELHLEFEVS